MLWSAKRYWQIFTDKREKKPSEKHEVAIKAIECFSRGFFSSLEWIFEIHRFLVATTNSDEYGQISNTSLSTVAPKNVEYCGISFVSSSRVLCTHHFLFYCLQYVINIHSISFFGAARSWICRFRLTLPSNPIAVVVPAILHAKIAHPDLNLDLDISSSDCHVVSRTSRIFCVAQGNVIDNSRVRWPWR